jgi:hypothetical protein
MLAERTFEVVLVTPTKGVGFSFAPVADAVVRHAGEALEVRVE